MHRTMPASSNRLTMTHNLTGLVMSHNLNYMPEPPPDRKSHILLVEDDEDMVILLRFYLERDGYTVTHASDGRRAKALIEEMAPPQLVLLDVLMPYFDGSQVLKHIRSKPAWREVPIIILTALSAEHNIVNLLDDGASDYVVKPFKPQELTARVRRLLRHSPLIAAHPCQ